MTRKEIDRSRTALKLAGAPADREHVKQALTARLRNEIELLRESKEGIRMDFRRQLERWRTETIPEHVPVAGIPTDVHTSRLYRVTGFFALMCECALAAWVFHIMIDGCFLKCNGRVLKGLVGEERMIHIDALPFYNKYTNIFSMDDVAEEERKQVARDVAQKIVAQLRQQQIH